MSVRNIVVAVSTVLVAAVVALVATIYFADRDIGAQPAGPPKPPQRPAAQPSQAAPAAPVRTETVTYDVWTVSCRYTTAEGKTTKACSATLPMVVQQQDRRVNVGAWIIAHNNEGALLSVLQTPQLDIGVLVGKGVELKLGEGKPHKVNFDVCNPQRCEAVMPLDETTIREATAAANGPASITFWKADGAEFTINIQSIKGIDKAIAAVR